jgi:hypothetical protein
VQEAFPLWGYPAGGSRYGLFCRMRGRAVELRALKSFSRSVIVEPVLARFEAADNRVPCGGVVLRCMLAWRSIAAADVTALGASAEMQPPSVRCQAFDAACTAWFRVQIDSCSFTFHARSFLSAVDSANQQPIRTTQAFHGVLCR